MAVWEPWAGGVWVGVTVVGVARVRGAGRFPVMNVRAAGLATEESDICQVYVAALELS